jgi:hypothetical protein
MLQSPRNSLFLLGFWMAGLFESVPVSAAAIPDRYVEIHAEIELITFVSTNNLDIAFEKRRKYSLRCVTGKNTWFIENDFVINAREFWYFDGTNVHRKVDPINAGSLTNQPAKSLGWEKPLTNIHSSIRPSPGGHPLGNLGVNIPWLVFCSGTFLKQSERIIPLPTTDIPGAPDAFIYADKTEIFGDELGLPKRIEFFFSRALYEKSVKDGRLPQNASDGALKFRYEVSQVTNFSGWTLPLKFEYTSYTEGAEGKWRPIVGGAGTVTDIRDGSRPVFPAAPTNNSIVTHPSDIVTSAALEETRLIKKRPLHLSILLVPVAILVVLLASWLGFAKKKQR